MNAVYKKLEKLCPGDRYPTQQRILDNARIPGTCQWFLDHETTQTWLNSDDRHVLWLHGPSASGKTFLSSSLVNHLKQDQYKEKGISCGVFYFGRHNVQCNIADYNMAFQSITRQLLSETKDLWQSVVEDAEMEYPDLSVTSKLLEKTSQVLRNAIIVLDGIDATNEAGLKELMRILFDHRDIPLLKILMTSRLPLPSSLKRNDPQVSELEARAPESDISLYLASYLGGSPVDTNVPDPARVDLSPHRKFCDLSSGLFLPLLPRWYGSVTSQQGDVFLDAIESLSPESDVSKAFCEAVMNDIKSCKDANLIMCVLYHLMMNDDMGYSFTAPMAYEALDAWNIRKTDGHQFTASEILKSCEGLTFVDKKNQTMVLRSPLLMEYLRTDVLGDDYHRQQIKASMRYLSKTQFANGPSRSSAELKERFQAHPYLWFAARCLSPNLAKGINTSFESDILTLTTSLGSIESYQQAAEAWPYFDDESYDECERSCERWHCYTAGYTALHLAASLGVVDTVIQKLFGSGADIEARDANGQTPLHIAADIENEYTTLKSLLLAGSDVAVKDRDDLTPLAIAIVHGNLTAVKLLIEYGADVSAVDEEDLRECVREKPEIAQFLTELGVDMPDVDESEDEGEDSETEE